MNTPSHCRNGAAVEALAQEIYQGIVQKQGEYLRYLNICIREGTYPEMCFHGNSALGGCSFCDEGALHEKTSESVVREIALREARNEMGV